jgi:hypothetical protein
MKESNFQALARVYFLVSIVGRHLPAHCRRYQSVTGALNTRRNFVYIKETVYLSAKMP